MATSVNLHIRNNENFEVKTTFNINGGDIYSVLKLQTYNDDVAIFLTMKQLDEIIEKALILKSEYRQYLDTE